MWIAEGFSTSNPFPKYRTSGSEQTIHAPSKQQQKKLQRDTSSHSAFGVILTEALLLFSFYQEPIHKNNSWKHKPAYYPLLYITKWSGFLRFVLVFYCEVGLTFFLPPPSHPPSPPPPNKKLIISSKRLIWLWKKNQKVNL